MGESLDDQLAALRERGEPLVAIALIHRELGVSLGEAKQYLHNHPAWRDHLAEWDETLDEFERHFANPS
jgi:hypothetical protein